ncbi:MAG: hypothetical protein WBU92_04400 [Candidatus Dormiibacterota bacterium]
MSREFVGQGSLEFVRRPAAARASLALFQTRVAPEVIRRVTEPVAAGAA